MGFFHDQGFPRQRARGAFSPAQFLAYRNSILDFEVVWHERSDAISERDGLKLEMARQQAKLEEKDNLIQARQNLINEKIVSSLESKSAAVFRAADGNAMSRNQPRRGHSKYAA